jgi:hypothetical protein
VSAKLKDMVQGQGNAEVTSGPDLE